MLFYMLGWSISIIWMSQLPPARLLLLLDTLSLFILFGISVFLCAVPAFNFIPNTGSSSNHNAYLFPDFYIFLLHLPFACLFSLSYCWCLACLHCDFLGHDDSSSTASSSKTISLIVFCLLFFFFFVVVVVFDFILACILGWSSNCEPVLKIRNASNISYTFISKSKWSGSMMTHTIAIQVVQGLINRLDKSMFFMLLIIHFVQADKNYTMRR